MSCAFEVGTRWDLLAQFCSWHCCLSEVNAEVILGTNAANFSNWVLWHIEAFVFSGKGWRRWGNKPGVYYFGDAGFIPECCNKLESLTSSSASPLECVTSCGFASICMKLHILSVAVFLLSCHSAKLSRWCKGVCLQSRPSQSELQQGVSNLCSVAVLGSAVPSGLADYLVFQFSACCVHGCSVLHIIMELVLTGVCIYFFPNTGPAVLLEKAVPVGCTLSCVH